MIKFWFVGPLILFASFAFLVFGVKNRVDLETERSGNFLEIRGPVEALYRPEHDFVNIIVLHLKNPNYLNTQVFVLSILEGGEVVRKLEFNGRNVGDPSDVRFQFEPLGEAAGKNLLLSVDQVTAGAEVEPFLSVAVTDEGRLAYRAYYRTPSKRDSFKQVFEGFFNRLSRDTFFVIVWFLGLCGIVILKNRKE